VLFPDSEERLTKRLQNGNKAAAKEFYALYADYLAGICSRYIINEEDQKDVFQESFIRIFSNISQFTYRGEGSLKAWATRIVVNESLKFLRSGLQHELIPIDMDMEDEVEEDPHVSDIPPDAIMEMLSRLPTGYRTVFNLYVFENRSHQEIAKMLGIKENSSASQLHRAKKLLAGMIREFKNKNNPG
jgi:RNA polymerase sigma-70 factor (ECF subfamily)